MPYLVPVPHGVNPDDWPVTSGRLIARACAPPRVTRLPDTEHPKEQRRRAFSAAGPRTSNPFHMDFERSTRGARSRTPTRMEDRNDDGRGTFDHGPSGCGR